MRTTKHTPGPWTYEYNPYTAQDGPEIPAYEVHGAEKVFETNEDRPAEEQEANARLGAAAPELLEALEYFFNIMHDYQSSLRKGYVRLAMDQARQALAVAKGEYS